MTYRWERRGSAVVFSRSSNKPLFVVLVLVGLVLVVVGAFGFAARTSAFIANFLQALFGAGVLFVVVATRALIDGDRYHPREVAFDGGRGAVRMPGAVEIPFGDIDGLDVRKAVAAVRDDGAVTTPTAFRHFLTVKSRATDFEVFSTTDFHEIERAVTAVRSCIAEADAATVSAPELPAQLVADHSAGATTLRWRNAHAGSVFTLLVAGAAIAFVLSRFAVLFAEWIVAAIAMFGMAVILAAVVLMNLARYLRDRGKTHELTVMPSSLRFDGRELPANANLEVRFEHQLGGSPSPIVIRGSGEPLAIDVASLTAAERIQLARWLRMKTIAAAYR